jgi:hypothetical protein
MYEYANATDDFAGMDWMVDCDWNEFIRFYYDYTDMLQPADPPLISIETLSTTYTLDENCHDEFRFIIPEEALYQFEAQIISGDVDFKIATNLGGELTILGYSELYNPDDAVDEVYQMKLPSGQYYLLLRSKEDSSFNILIKEIDYETLQMNTPITKFGCSFLGDVSGHFIQTSNYYYQIELGIDSYTFQLNNSELVNFKLAIYTLDWALLIKNNEAIAGENIILELNSTTTQTVVLMVFGSLCSGEFTLEVIGKAAGKFGLSFNVIIGLAIITIPVILFLKRKKK